MKKVMEKEKVRYKMAKCANLIKKNWRAKRDYAKFKIALKNLRTSKACVIIQTFWRKFKTNKKVK